MSVITQAGINLAPSVKGWQLSGVKCFGDSPVEVSYNSDDVTGRFQLFRNQNGCAGVPSVISVTRARNQVA